MIVTYVLILVLAAAFGVIGSAKLMGHRAMRSRAVHIGFTMTAFRRIGAVEVLAAVGLVAGLFVEWIAAVAAIGLVLLLAGAVIVHLRNHDGPREIAPALTLGAACVCLVGLILAGAS